MRWYIAIGAATGGVLELTFLWNLAATPVRMEREAASSAGRRENALRREREQAIRVQGQLRKEKEDLDRVKRLMTVIGQLLLKGEEIQYGISVTSNPSDVNDLTSRIVEWIEGVERVLRDHGLEYAKYFRSDAGIGAETEVNKYVGLSPPIAACKSSMDRRLKRLYEIFLRL